MMPLTSNCQGWKSSVTRWKVTMGYADSPYLKRVTVSVKSEKGFAETIRNPKETGTPWLF